MTPKQRDILKYIEDFWAENGCGPSYDEIAAAHGLRSRSNAHRMVRALKASGWVKITPGRARTVRSTYRHRTLAEHVKTG